jgi:hypothetical protein
MAKRSSARLWLTPITTVSFLVVMMTGVLMLLHLRDPLVLGIHELTSIVFALSGVLHLVLNWRGLMGIIGQRTGLVALVSALAVCAVLGLLGAFHHPEEGGPHRERQGQREDRRAPSHDARTPE